MRAWSVARLTPCRSEGARHGDVRFGVEMQMPELPLADVEVGAVDDRFVAELPMRARLDGCPFFHDERLVRAPLVCSAVAP